MILKNKKGQDDISGRKTIFYIIFGFLTTIVFLVVVFLVPANASDISRIPNNLENYIMIHRFLNSPDCFAYHDQITGRVYPGIIDLDKFTENNLNACFNAEDQNVMGYRLTLRYEGNERVIETNNWRGFLLKAETKNIQVFDEGVIKEATLFVEVQDDK